MHRQKNRHGACTVAVFLRPVVVTSEAEEPLHPLIGRLEIRLGVLIWCAVVHRPEYG